ncbi:ribosome hibernation-promoting factor, HPF/YfiA family [Shewanella sp. NFH-SH190041]|uniref:ribosome hibernation-promoting factor, HPF/YfiA family n=1 Tax=Shewanella sp. NFH-SH190041 TaxID=2950245 RepID=UPI0021C268A7|nr:ribosome-associated translation inhibitor RaiA [Shewanella sp. NFH-SH190041]
MNGKITAKGFELTAEQRDFIISKLEKLDKYQVTFHSQDVFVKLEPPKQFHIEIAVKSSVGPIEASADNKNYHEALAEVFDRLERQLIKQKDKPLASRNEPRDYDKMSETEELEATDAAIESVKESL